MKYSLPRSTISKKAQHGILCAFILFRKSKSGARSYLCADYPMPSEELFLYAKQVHAAAFAFTAPGGFRIQFSHTQFCGNPFCDRKSMVAVRRNENILIFCGCHTAGS